MNFHTILFDLDGTVTDPKEGITRCVAYALEHFGIKVDDLDTLIPFIGPPLVDSFSGFYGMNETDSLIAVEKYRERFRVTGWAENKPYEGIAELLGDLKKAGKRISLATSKPEEFALKILYHFDLAQYFDLICGAPMHAHKGHGKVDVIEDALARMGITDRSGIIMVGDRLHDIEGAHKAGLPCVGVLFGYGDRAEHEKYGADYIVEDMSALREFLLNH